MSLLVRLRSPGFSRPSFGWCPVGLAWLLTLLASLGCSSEGSTDNGGGGTGGVGGGGTWTFAPSQLSLGSLGSCAGFDGQLWCWGWNQNEQFGTARDTQFERPTRIHELGTVREMALGGDFACALLSWGVQCMGYDHGGTDGPVDFGTAMPAGLAVGHGHACALVADGSVSCWGQNESGQLGDGTPQGRVDPAPVAGLSDAVAVAAAADRSCALDGSGAVWCWGRRLDSSGDPRLAPEPIAGLATVEVLGMSADQSCVLLTDGSVSCWGHGACNALDLPDSCDAPVPVPGLPAVEELAIGDSAGCARAGSELYCWGRNARGQLGDGTLDASPNPKPVPGLTAQGRVAFGSDHVCAASQDSVYCWGSNGNGQIGNGTTIDQLTPVDVRP